MKLIVDDIKEKGGNERETVSVKTPTNKSNNHQRALINK